MRKCGLATIALALTMLSLPVSALAQDIASPRLEQLRADAERLRREAGAMGDTDTIFGALNNLRQREFDLVEQDRRMDMLIAAAGGRVTELEEYRKSEEARRIHDHADGLEDIGEEVRDHVLEGIADAVGAGAGKAVGVLTLLLDVAGNVTLKAIKESDLTAFRQLIADERIRVSQLYALKIAIEVDRVRTTARIRAVEAKRAEYDAKMVEIATERARLEADSPVPPQESPPSNENATHMAILLRDADTLADAFEAVTALTGMPVEPFKWHWSAGALGTEKVAYCPPFSGVVSPVVYGTDRYDLSSALCFSAVHAGMISLSKGGFVRIVMLPPNSVNCEVTTRNGVTSSDACTKGRPAFRFQRV